MSGQLRAAIAVSEAATSASSDPYGRPLMSRPIQRALAHDGRSSPPASPTAARSSSATGTSSVSVILPTLEGNRFRATMIVLTSHLLGEDRTVHIGRDHGRHT
jgi:hypothetical protein